MEKTSFKKSSLPLGRRVFELFDFHMEATLQGRTLCSIFRDTCWQRYPHNLDISKQIFN